MKKKNILMIILTALGTFALFFGAKFLLDNAQEEARQNRRFDHVMGSSGETVSITHSTESLETSMTLQETQTTGKQSSETTTPEKSPKEVLYSIRLTDQEGNTRGLEEFEGKLVFVNYWASWCGPCRREMPALETFYNKYKDDEDFVFLSINSTGGRETKADADRFVEEGGYTFPYFYDEEMAFVYELYFNSIPVTFTVFPDGTPGYLHFGEATMQDFEEILADTRTAYEERQG